MHQSEASSLPLHQPIAPLPRQPAGRRVALAGAGLLALTALPAGLYLAPTAGALALAAIGIGAPLIWIVWARPELGLLALTFMTSSFIRADAIDLRLPVGGLDLRDLALVGLIGLLLVQRLLRREVIVPWWPVSGPLLALIGCACFSALYAIMYQQVEAHWALGELRPFIFFGVALATAWSIARADQLVVLLVGLFLLADITAAIILLQQLVGLSGRLLGAMDWAGGSWRVWQADGAGGFGAVRIVPPGHIMMFAMSLVAFSLLLLGGRQRPYVRAILIAQFVFINAGLLLTYTRAQWIASALGLAVIVMLLPRSGKAQLARYAIGLGAALALVVVLFGAQMQQTLARLPFLSAVTDRALTLFTPGDTLETYSLQWRVFETEAALRSIDAHPLLGVGLGNSYRQITTLQGEANGYLTSFVSGEFDRFTRFVHNSYLYLAVKIGMLGLLAFFQFCLAFLVQSWNVYRGLSDGYAKRIVLALLASFVGFLSWAITEPHLFYPESTAMIGLIIGMVASLRPPAEPPAGSSMLRPQVKSYE